MPKASAPRADPGESDLERAVRRELERAGRVDSFEGQLALLLAQRLPTQPSGTVVGVADELRAAMGRALRDTGPEDDVARARRLRDEKRREAGLEGDR